MFFINWLVVLIFDWGIIFAFAYLLDYEGILFEYIRYLTAVLLVVIDYFFIRSFYKDAKIISKIIGIISVLVINAISLVAADKLIHSDDAFAILEGSKIIVNSQIVLLLAVIISSINFCKKNRY